MAGRPPDSADTPATAAIEANAAEFLLALGRAGGGEERSDPTIQWTVGGSPLAYHNAVVRAELAGPEVDARIAAFVARLGAREVPGSWHVGPSMRPGDIAARLLDHGFVHGDDEAGMAVDLRTVDDRQEAPSGMRIRQVRSHEDLDEWVRTLGAGFGEGPHEAEWVGSIYSRVGLHDATPWRHYLAHLDGRAVATASLFLAARVAGVYFVFTLPEVRRRGIGAAMTLACLREARRLGYRVGVLGASHAGESVYRRLGFARYCTIGIYEWSPD
jgi:GNAT superfamily N-acetyltransferase